jgi:hypothetical protein
LIACISSPPLQGLGAAKRRQTQQPARGPVCRGRVLRDRVLNDGHNGPGSRAATCRSLVFGAFVFSARRNVLSDLTTDDNVFSGILLVETRRTRVRGSTATPKTPILTAASGSRCSSPTTTGSSATHFRETNTLKQGRGGHFVETPSIAGRARSFNGRYVLLQRSAAGQSEVVGHPEHSSRALKSCRRGLGASSRPQSLSLRFAP